MSEREIALFIPLLIFGVVSVYWLISYLLKGFGMYGIAKNLGMKNGWLAFIPIAWQFLQGELAGEISIGGRTVKNPGIWTLLLPFFTSLILVPFCFIYAIIVGRLFDVLDRIPEHGLYGLSGPYLFLYLFMAIFIIFIIIIKAVQKVVYGLVRFKTYVNFMDDSLALIHAVFGLFIPLYYQIVYFVLRNKKPIFKADLPLYSVDEINEEQVSNPDENADN